MEQQDKKTLIKAMIFPILFVLILLVVEIIITVANLDPSDFGIKPLSANGLLGILSAPLIHSGFKHLISNCVPLLILGTGLFYFYKDIAYKVFFASYFLVGILIWLMARGPAAHIGASGIVYSLIAFHLVSALLRRRKDLAAYSLIVIFLYGSFIWGFFPEFFPDTNISWQGHLSGVMVGMILGFYFKDKGPQHETYIWEEDEDKDNENDISISDAKPDTKSDTKPVDDADRRDSIL